MCPLENPIQSINGSNSISFSHGRIVKCRIHEIVEGVGGALLCHDGLPDMDDFGCVGSETMDPKNFKSLTVEQQLEHADGTARNLSPC